MRGAGQHILYAEDQEDDVFFMEAASKASTRPHTLHVVRNGQQAIHYLSGEHPYHSRSEYPLPSLLLLDIYMPVVGGLEVLEWLQGRPEFRHLPVFLVSSFVRRSDLETTDPLAITGYWNKSSKLQDWATFIDDCLLASHNPITAPEFERQEFRGQGTN